MNTPFMFDEFPVLQTDRFNLRAADEQDASDLLALYSNETVVEFMPFTPLRV